MLFKVYVYVYNVFVVTEKFDFCFYLYKIMFLWFINLEKESVLGNKLLCKGLIRRKNKKNIIIR